MLLFFASYGDHRDLHSFPTRRSSDLRELSERTESSIPRHGRLRSVDPWRRPRPGTSIDREPPSRFARSPQQDRKSTRLNSSHSQISYAVFCLKKKRISAHTLSNRLRV